MAPVLALPTAARPLGAQMEYTHPMQLDVVNLQLEHAKRL
jgi:hypothetical protein